MSRSCPLLRNRSVRLVLVVFGLVSGCGDSGTGVDPVEVTVTPTGSPWLWMSTSDTLRLTARASDADGAVIQNTRVEWSSTQPERISVDSGGLLRSTSSYTSV